MAFSVPSDSHQLLVQRVEELTRNQHDFQSFIPNLRLYRADKPNKPTGSLHAASLCMIVQGEKEVNVGNETYNYNARHFLFTTIDLPVIAHIRKASKDKPYLTIILGLDPHLVNQFILEAKIPPLAISKPVKSITTGQVTEGLSNCFLRLLNLKNDSALPVLSTLILKEIYYRLLISPQGRQLHHILTHDTKGHKIHNAILSLKNRFAEPLNMDKIALQTGMSPSSFYQHFKNITSMSPLQYQKRLRLTEARRLLLNKKGDITSVSLQVGYESNSQFSREYKRFFGTCPSLDIKRFLEG